MNKKSFSLVELIIVIVVLSILAAGLYSFFIPILNLFFHLPQDLQIKYFSGELTSAIIDGDNLAKGLAFAKVITAATAIQVDYTDQDDNALVIRYDTAADSFYRNINAGGEALIPVQFSGDVKVKGTTSANVAFNYYDSSGVVISSPVADVTTIESIEMDLTIYTGTGEVKDFQSRLDIKTGVDIKQF